MERIKIFTNDSRVSHEQISKIKAQLGYHLGPAPSDASICCCIHKEDQQLVCNLRIHSARGHIHIHRESKSLETLLKFTYDSITQSLKQWKQNPELFEKSHPMGSTPCRDHKHKVIQCPFQSFANKSFESKEL